MTVYVSPGSLSLPVFWEWPAVIYFNRDMPVMSDFNPGDSFDIGLTNVRYSVADEYGVLLMMNDFAVEVKGKLHTYDKYYTSTR